MKFYPLPVALVAASLLAGCAGTLFHARPSAIYYQDGRPAFVARCDRGSWAGCLSQAGEQCRAAGYDVLEKHAGFGVDGVNELVFACRGEPVAAQGAAEASPAAK